MFKIIGKLLLAICMVSAMAYSTWQVPALAASKVCDLTNTWTCIMNLEEGDSLRLTKYYQHQKFGFFNFGETDCIFYGPFIPDVNSGEEKVTNVPYASVNVEASNPCNLYITKLEE